MAGKVVEMRVANVPRDCNPGGVHGSAAGRAFAIDIRPSRPGWLAAHGVRVLTRHHRCSSGVEQEMDSPGAGSTPAIAEALQGFFARKGTDRATGHPKGTGLGRRDSKIERLGLSSDEGEGAFFGGFDTRWQAGHPRRRPRETSDLAASSQGASAWATARRPWSPVQQRHRAWRTGASSPDGLPSPPEAPTRANARTLPHRPPVAGLWFPEGLIRACAGVAAVALLAATFAGVGGARAMQVLAVAGWQPLC